MKKGRCNLNFLMAYTALGILTVLVLGNMKIVYADDSGDDLVHFDRNFIFRDTDIVNLKSNLNKIKFEVHYPGSTYNNVCGLRIIGNSIFNNDVVVKEYNKELVFDRGNDRSTGFFKIEDRHLYMAHYSVETKSGKSFNELIRERINRSGDVLSPREFGVLSQAFIAVKSCD